MRLPCPLPRSSFAPVSQVSQSQHPALFQMLAFGVGVFAAVCWWLLFFRLLPALDRQRYKPCSLRAPLCSYTADHERRVVWCHLHHWLVYLLLGTALYLAPANWPTWLRWGGIGFSVALFFQGLSYKDRFRFCYLLPQAKSPSQTREGA